MDRLQFAGAAPFHGTSAPSCEGHRGFIVYLALDHTWAPQGLDTRLLRFLKCMSMCFHLKDCQKGKDELSFVKQSFSVSTPS